MNKKEKRIRRVAKIILLDGQQFDINRQLEEEEMYRTEQQAMKFEEEEENSEIGYVFRNFFGY